MQEKRPIPLAGYDLAELVRADRWLRSLARELVGTSGDPDDVAQDSWLAAVEEGTISALRAWMRTVTSRIAIRRREGDRSRRDWERFSTLKETVLSPAEIVEREDSRRQIVDTMLALQEPLRTTLILRFLEDLTPRE